MGGWVGGRRTANPGFVWVGHCVEGVCVAGGVGEETGVDGLWWVGGWVGGWVIDGWNELLGSMGGWVGGLPVGEGCSWKGRRLLALRPWAQRKRAVVGGWVVGGWVG